MPESIITYLHGFYGPDGLRLEPGARVRVEIGPRGPWWRQLLRWLAGGDPNSGMYEVMTSTTARKLSAEELESQEDRSLREAVALAAFWGVV